MLIVRMHHLKFVSDVYMLILHTFGNRYTAPCLVYLIIVRHVLYLSAEALSFKSNENNVKSHFHWEDRWCITNIITDLLEASYIEIFLVILIQK